MFQFILRRAAMMLPTLFGVTVVVFLMLQLVPGDPVDSLLSVGATEEDRQRVISDLGLDEPLYLQYINWIFDVVRGDLGTSILRKIDVGSLMADGLWYTFLLAAAAGLWSFALSFVIGIYSAYRPKSKMASFANLMGLTGLSLPNFWAALIFIGIFSVTLGWLPSSGTHSLGSNSVLDLFRHLLLPALATGMTTLGIMIRMVRSTVQDILQRDFVINLRAKGASPAVVLKHVIKNAVPGILTVAGLQFGYLLGGSVLVETVFSWPGVGMLIYQAISQRDYPIIQAGILIVSILFVCINLIVDIIQSLVDPRIRTS
jgi:peptide/nickel transport system permease protein